MKPMQNRRVAVRGVVVLDGKLLGVRLKAYPGKATSDGLDYWCTPGGGVDIGEPLLPALEREIIEEVGVKPEIGNLLYIQQFEHKGTEHLEFFFHVTNAKDFTAIDLTATTHGSVEVAQVDFIDAATNTVLPAFLTKVDLEADIATGAVQVFNYLAYP
jgi:8-oxo-dGTP diphosphatase